jgi:hypothetical protein
MQDKMTKQPSELRGMPERDASLQALQRGVKLRIVGDRPARCAQHALRSLGVVQR